MTTMALRKQLHGYIETMPEKKLKALKPLLSEMAEPLYIIELASPEETAKGQKIMKEYHKDPSCFIPWKDVKLGKTKSGRA